MTAHIVSNGGKKVYCTIWNESQSGRGGNDIASAANIMLNRIIKDFPLVNQLILWFDSCVPQNRNSYMSTMLREFIVKNPNIDVLQQKFCEPGNSSIQEIDNVHSQIEKYFSKLEIFSPIGVVRNLLIVNRDNPFIVMQMKPSDYKNYKNVAELLHFKDIPYSKAKTLCYRKDHHGHIFLKISFANTL